MVGDCTICIQMLFYVNMSSSSADIKMFLVYSKA